MAIDWNSVGIAAGTAFCGVLAVLFFGCPLLRAVSEIRSLPKMVQGALAVLALVATLNAQKLRSGGGGPPDPPAAVTQEEVARGYRLVSETNETGHSFAMPSNAAYVGRLHEHGARTDFGMHRVDFGAWAFPCGTNCGLRSRLWWFMDGRLQEGYCEATNIHGFFLQTTILPHGTDAGAWKEVDVGEDNSAGNDFASATFSPRPEAPAQGGYEYQIPMRWYVKSGGTPVAYNPMGNVPQVFTLSPNGDFSVSKFGHTVVCDTNGVPREVLGAQ